MKSFYDEINGEISALSNKIKEKVRNHYDYTPMDRNTFTYLNIKYFMYGCSKSNDYSEFVHEMVSEAASGYV